jgi:FMN reductase
VGKLEPLPWASRRKVDPRSFVVSLSVVVGNPKPQSRTFAIACALADRLSALLGLERTLTIDLTEYSDSLFKWPNPEVDALNEAVRETDLSIIASPTYKGAYTGMLKAFLDRYSNNSLEGLLAVPLMTAGAPEHAMAVEVTLRPLLVELGAAVPTRGLHFLMTDMPRMDKILDEWAEKNAYKLKAACTYRHLRALSQPGDRPAIPDVRSSDGS